MKTHENVDLFEHVEQLPKEVQEVLNKYAQEDNTYESCASLLSELKPLGYTFQYGLDTEPFSLRKIIPIKWIDGKAVVKEGRKVIAKIYDRRIFFAKLPSVGWNRKFQYSIEIGSMMRECTTIDECLYFIDLYNF